MPLSFKDLYEKIHDEGHFPMLSLNPLAQFQSDQGALVGARLLPERLVPQNEYRETQIRWKVKPALDNNRYSPTQMQKSGQLIGGFMVELSHTDTQNQLTAKDYDDLLILLAQANGDMQAIARIIQWADMTLIKPHTLKNEIQRWQAWLLGEVPRKTVEGNMEPLKYHVEPGLRFDVAGGTKAAPAGWHDPAYDIFGDIGVAVEKLEDKGYQATGLYAMPRLGRVIKNNDTVKSKGGYTRITEGAIESQTPRLTDRTLQSVFLDEFFPTLTTYNNGYEGDGGFKHFMDVEAGYDYMMVTGSTNRNYDMAIDYAGTTGTDVSGYTAGALQLTNVLGYHAVGRNAGESTSGRTITTKTTDVKPKGLWGESYQTALPVTQDPQAYAIIRVQQPT